VIQVSQFFKDVKDAFDLTKRHYELKKFKFSDLKRLLPYMKSHWGKASLASILVVFLSLSALPVPYLMKLLFDDAFGGKNFKMLNIILLIMLGFQLLRVVVSFLMNYLFTILSQYVMIEVRKDLFHRLLKLPLSFFDKTQSGYLLSRISEVGGLRVLFSSSVIQVFTGLLEFTFCLGILFYLHWPVAVIGLTIIPFYYMAARYFSKGLRTSTQEFFEKIAIASKDIQESLAGISEIKAFASEDKEARKIHKSLKSVLKINIIQSIFFSISSEVILLVGTLGSYAVLWYSGFRIVRGELTIGDYIAFAGYLGKLFSPTQMIASLSLTLQPVTIALQRVSHLFDMVTEEEDANRTLRVSKLNGEIIFKHVSFCYEGREETLQDVSFRIKPQETVAFVGPSGSGKTTIIRLILGFYRANGGEILIDGQNINRYVLTDLRERIGIVSQNIFLFNDTIRNNIRYSNSNAGEEEIIGTAKIAHAHDFIMSFPDGYDTRIGEKGMTLSGGQIQRIAIARAILKEPDILIFDEATSHVDNQTEQSITADIDEIFKGKTRIIITHRMSSIEFTDQIYVIDEGKLARQGKYRELFRGDEVIEK
jgi:ABC-type bacteriocin/lantibiotic exporter with double-glycine peptidase domain